MLTAAAPTAPAAATQALWQATQKRLQAALHSGSSTAWSVHVRVRGVAYGSLHLGHARLFECDPHAPGKLERLPQPEVLTPRHLFDWASISKVAGTMLAIMALVADGELRLADTLGALLPQWQGGDKASIRIEQLLAYRSGLPAWRPLYLQPAQRTDLLHLLQHTPLVAPIGSQRLYSDLGHLLLGAIVEQRTQMRLSDYLQQRVFAPLGLKTVAYGPIDAALAPCVATSHGNIYERRMLDEADFGIAAADKGQVPGSDAFAHWRTGSIVGAVDDGNAHYLMQGCAGHAGLFGDAEALAQLAEAMVLPGAAADKLGLSAAVQQRFAAADGHNELLSWWPGALLGLADLPAQQALAPAPALMMRGFTGTAVYVEPQRGLVVSMLSNREHVSATGDYSNLRPVFADVLQIWRHGV